MYNRRMLIAVIVVVVVVLIVAGVYAYQQQTTLVTSGPNLPLAQHPATQGSLVPSAAAQIDQQPAQDSGSDLVPSKSLQEPTASTTSTYQDPRSPGSGMETTARQTVLKQLDAMKKGATTAQQKMTLQYYTTLMDTAQSEADAQQTQLQKQITAMMANVSDPDDKARLQQFMSMVKN